MTSVARTQLTLWHCFFLQYECGNSGYLSTDDLFSIFWVSVFETSLRYDSAILHLLRKLKWKMNPTQHIRKMYKLGILVQENVSQCIWLLYCLHTKFGDVQIVKVGRRVFAFSFSMNHSNLSGHMQEYNVKRMTAHTHWSSWSVGLREWRAGLG